VEDTFSIHFGNLKAFQASFFQKFLCSVVGLFVSCSLLALCDNFGFIGKIPTSGSFLMILPVILVLGNQFQNS
jgi:hypothetical protein